MAQGHEAQLLLSGVSGLTSHRRGKRCQATALQTDPKRKPRRGHPPGRIENAGYPPFRRSRRAACPCRLHLREHGTCRHRIQFDRRRWRHLGGRRSRRRGHAGRRRRTRRLPLHRLGGLGRRRVAAWIVVGNDSANGGENLLHRGLLTLRRLRHRPCPGQGARAAARRCMKRISAWKRPFCPMAATMTRRRSNAKKRVPILVDTYDRRRMRHDRSIAGRPVGGCSYRPSGTRTPPQASRICW